MSKTAPVFQPSNEEELRDALQQAALARQPIEITGNNTKRLMGGKSVEPAVRISTGAMRRILRYEPRDLTISVEAGMPFAALQAELAKHGQMIPLDGPYSDSGTVGGMVAANIYGHRRRLYGTARDLVIGMRFATVEGKLINTGGMVVKNVAGLDMGKILIGSYGTLAAIVSVNFKLIPIPPVTRTFLFHVEDCKVAGKAIQSLLTGQLTPTAVELLNPMLCAQVNQKGWLLAVSFGGNEKVMKRITQEMMGSNNPQVLAGEEQARFWRLLQSVTPKFLEKFSDCAIVRISTPISAASEALGLLENSAVGGAHAGSGVVRGWFTRPDPAIRYLNTCLERGWRGVIEAAGDGVRSGIQMWPKPGEDFALMQRIKHMFDPEGVLNRGRLLQII